MYQSSKSVIYKDAPGTVMVGSYNDCRMGYSIGMSITHKLLRSKWRCTGVKSPTLLDYVRCAKKRYDARHMNEKVACEYADMMNPVISREVTAQDKRIGNDYGR